MTAELRIIEGDCWAFFAFDAAYAIDLDAAHASLTAATRDERARREDIPRRRGLPTSLQFRPVPLRVEQPVGPIEATPIAGLRLAPRAICTLYDFGAISVAYRIPLNADDPAGRPIATLIPLADQLRDLTSLRDDARARVNDLIRRLGPALDRPDLADPVEDYVVHHARAWMGPTGQAAADILAAAHDAARLLLGEPGPLAPQAIDAALSARLAYSPSDAAVVDWNGSLVLGADEEDTLAVLEFVNVELLELRVLDDRLDAVIDRSSRALLRRDARGSWPASPLGLLVDPHRAQRRHLAAMQMDSAVLFEGVNNALKLVGDQHLARLYALAAARLHLADWDQSILRKLHTVEQLYEKLADEQSTRRMELLEWIIIVLIALSIVLPFIPGFAGK